MLRAANGAWELPCEQGDSNPFLTASEPDLFQMHVDLVTCKSTLEMRLTAQRITSVPSESGSSVSAQENVVINIII